MSAKGGKAFFQACGQRDEALNLRLNPACMLGRSWPHWAKAAYYHAYTAQRYGRVMRK